MGLLFGSAVCHGRIESVGGSGGRNYSKWWVGTLGIKALASSGEDIYNFCFGLFNTAWGVLMRKFWVACGLVLFTLGILTGCRETTAPPPKDKPAASATDAAKPADGKKASKPAPGKARSRIQRRASETAASRGSGLLDDSRGCTSAAILFDRHSAASRRSVIDGCGKNSWRVCECCHSERSEESRLLQWQADPSLRSG